MAAATIISEFHEYRGTWELDEIYRVLADMERLSSRIAPKDHTQQRACPRRPYSAPVTIRQQAENRNPGAARASLQVAARNLSQSGIGVLAPLFFKARSPDVEAPILRAKEFFCDGAAIDVGLMLSKKSLLWVSGVVVRTRIVQHDFMDIGIQFKAKIQEHQLVELDNKIGLDRPRLT